ncbi:MAG: hypothetical protein IJ222_02600 [Bacteroidales bacterium]|nr:hypothetical protein [Bacteroidales bacterium]
MKKIALFISALCLALSVSAQPAQQKGRPDGKDRQQNHKEMISRLQSEHIAFLTAELDLSPEEAQAFWPVFNKVQKEQMEIHKALGAASKKLRDALKENKSDKELKDALSAYNKAKQNQKSVLADYQNEFIKILGVQKAAKLYVAEESFRTRQINKLGQGRKDGKPQGAPKGQKKSKPTAESN